MRRSRALAPVFALLLAVLAWGCARPAPDPAAFSLTIAHVNDTHSNLEPAETRLRLGGRNVTAELGGFARLKGALDEARAGARADGSRFLALHAGDAVQGTLFFNVFQGRADFDLLNLLGLDAMTLGNHEFDRGPGLTAELLGRARFPVVSANIDASREPALAGRIAPYAIRDLGGGARVGVVGVTTPGTPNISSPGAARFLPAAPAVARAVGELHARGVDAVIVLSHLGYAEDLRLAREVAGVAVIVGGHSHSLLGDPAQLGPLGLAPAGPYPTVVTRPDGAQTLVVQAWRWGMQLGVLRVAFDAQGRVAGFEARPALLAGGGFREGGAAVPEGSPRHAELTDALLASGAARRAPADPEVLRALAPLAAQLDGFRHTPIGARAAVDLLRGTPSDPGPLIADAYLAATPGAQIALLMPGGVRQDIFAGDITQGMVQGVLPFGNTLVRLDLTGAELRAALEDAAEFRLRVRPDAGRQGLLFHAAGLTCRIDPAAPKGARVQELLVRGADGGFTAYDPSAIYRLVTNSFLAGGGDGMATLKNALGPREDTGILESDALAEHLKRLGVAQPPAGERVRVEPGRPLTLLLPRVSSRPGFASAA